MSEMSAETPEREIRATLREKIERKSYEIEIGGKSPAALLAELSSKGMRLGQWYPRFMIESPDFKTLAKPAKIRVVKIKLNDLDFAEWASHDDFINKWVTYDNFIKKAQSLGLTLLPAEAGPHARLQDRNQTKGKGYMIAMKPIRDQSHSQSVFYVRRDEKGLWLDGAWVYPGTDLFKITNEATVLFGVRK